MVKNLFSSKKSKEILLLKNECEEKAKVNERLKIDDKTKTNEIAKLLLEHEVKVNKLAEKEQLVNELIDRENILLAIKSALEGTSAAIMMIDLNFIVTYVNKATINLFTEHATEFKTAFPMFDPKKIVGTCIDVFHKRPEHQRQMLSDPSRLPFKTDIKLGSLTIALYVTATYGQNGNHSGNILEWRNVTEERRKSLEDLDAVGQLAALNHTQGVIEIGLDGKILKTNEIYLKMLGYSANELIGKHVNMVLDPTFAKSAEYAMLWDKLVQGGNEVGQYKRITKSGHEIWIQASYNPIKGADGKPFKIVNFTIDITEQHNNALSLTKAVEETQAIIEEAKSGDLSSRVTLVGKTGAIASLCDGVNALMDKMTEVIVQVREAGETINTAAGEISSGNNDLSSRTEQQASSLEETAASMEELASTVKNNADNAKQANQLAAVASNVALKGGEVVNQVVTTMSSINESAKKIEDIISVIDGIAFQTNILALNAAVEAARAGEQGRGFAVVAGEVRNLAQRSAGAAKEIKGLITDSVKKTAEGTTQVEQAGKTMQEIVTSVQHVTDIMGEITAASVEQSAGIDQVNAAVTSMDEVTQQNAALVEEAAAAAESLVDQAMNLLDVVGQFKLQGHSNHHNFSSNNSIIVHTSKSTRPATRYISSKSATFKQAKIAVKTSASNSDWEEF